MSNVGNMTSVGTGGWWTSLYVAPTTGSMFRDSFLAGGIDSLQRGHAVTVTFHDVSEATDTVVSAISQEFVGATDPFEDRLYNIKKSDLSGDPTEGDRITDAALREWTSIKVRDTQHGTWEIRTRAPAVNT